MPLIFFKTAEDAVLILSQRQALIYPFTATAWTDLRLGVYLSVTNATENDNPTALLEDLSITEPSLFANHVYIGFKQNNGGLPGNNSMFAGLTTLDLTDAGDHTWLVPSNGTTTTTGTLYWRAYRNTASVSMKYIHSGTVQAAPSIDLITPIGTGLFLRQTGGTGYAALNMIRLVRPTSDAVAPISINVQGGASINHDYTDTPTIERIREFLRNSTFNQSAIIATMVPVPNALYFYWPYFNSRLRIHAIVLEKFS